MDLIIIIIIGCDAYIGFEQIKIIGCDWPDRAIEMKMDMLTLITVLQNVEKTTKQQINVQVSDLLYGILSNSVYCIFFIIGQFIVLVLILCFF